MENEECCGVAPQFGGIKARKQATWRDSEGEYWVVFNYIETAFWQRHTWNACITVTAVYIASRSSQQARTLVWARHQSFVVNQCKDCCWHRELPGYTHTHVIQHFLPTHSHLTFSLKNIQLKLKNAVVSLLRTYHFISEALLKLIALWRNASNKTETFLQLWGTTEVKHFKRLMTENRKKLLLISCFLATQGAWLLNGCSALCYS